MVMMSSPISVFVTVDHSGDHFANLDGADYDEVMLRGIGGPESGPRRGTDQGKVT